MEFLLLVVINIFMGAIFYLVISLKLEKSATEFREKRLRREMDTVMREFNLAAERNITILENKIAVMKKLLEMNGDLKSLDVTVGDDIQKKGLNLAEENSPREKSAETASDGHAPALSFIKAVRLRLMDFCERFLLVLYDFLVRILNRSGRTVPGSDEKAPSLFEQNLGKIIDARPAGSGALNETGGLYDIKIEKDFKDLRSMEEKREPESTGINEEEIIRIVSSSRDRYSVISELHGKGCPADTIAKYSGIPAGEISLVLNLAGPR